MHGLFPENVWVLKAFLWPIQDLSFFVYVVFWVLGETQHIVFNLPKKDRVKVFAIQMKNSSMVPQPSCQKHSTLQKIVGTIPLLVCEFS